MSGFKQFAIHHAVKAHRSKPVEPVHDPRKIVRFLWRHQVMRMIAHNAEGVELEAKLFLASLDGEQQQFPTFKASQSELSIIATGCDVVAIVWVEVARLARHG